MTALGISVVLTCLPGISDWVDFIGFSEDETYAAWRIHEIRRDAETDTEDRYELIRVVATKTGLECGLYRASPVLRTVGGSRVPTSRRRLLTDNPSYAGALPAKRWASFLARHSFAASSLDGSAGSVQLVTSRQVRVENTGHVRRLHSRAQSGQFEILGQLADGRNVSVAQGDFSDSVELVVYHSYTGYHAAVVQRSLDGNKDTEPRVWTVRFRGMPLANSARRDTPRSGQVAMMLFRDAQKSQKSWAAAQW